MTRSKDMRAVDRAGLQFEADLGASIHEHQANVAHQANLASIAANQYAMRPRFVGLKLLWGIVKLCFWLWLAVLVFSIF